MWKTIIEELKKAGNKEINTFIDALSPKEESREKIVVNCKSKYAYDFLKKNNYLSKIEKTAKTLFDEKTEIQFIVIPENEEKNLQLEFDFKDENKINKINDKIQDEYEKYKDYTFNNFVMGPSNAGVYLAAQAIAKNPGTGYNPFFIYGDSGLGKTHIVQAIGNYIINNKHKKVYYSTTNQLLIDYINAIESKTINDFREKIIKNDVLLIDDIQFLSGKSGTQNEFFYIFNQFYDKKKQIVITSDKHITEINDIDSRLRSRFSMGVTLEIIPPEYETRVAIIKKKSELYDMKIEDEVADFIASNIKNNVREIEGALQTLKISYEFIGNGVIDLKFAENILKKMIKKQPREIEDIIKIVSAETKVKPSDIVSKSRTKGISISRQIAIYLTRKYTSKTFKEIGEKFGKRDHSTIITSISNIEKLILDNEQISKLVAKLSKEIESSEKGL
ncbi:chromosomal replication initiator protein DnaA [bacterium]|nr:chromosomal replication initiator protein DnaA [bacterium]MBQ4438131.1 chromosomal replication initiator protein DnaA [bacterium]